MRRTTSVSGTILLALVLAVTSWFGSEARGQTPSEVPAEKLIAAARAALAQGEIEDAAFLLKGVKRDEGNADDLDFLHGSIAMRRGDWQTAIARFRAMLARNPDLPRVRLDLALAYFQAEDDANAAHHFRVALGTKDLPEAVRGQALAFLDRIRRRKGWSITGSLALAPDTNINTATAARQILLSGLPATLSEDGRRTSGVGVTANLFGSHETRILPDLRFRVGGGIQTRTYRENAFTEQTLSLRAGPRFLLDKFDLRPELTARQRWIGGDAYSRTLGFELEGSWFAGPAWRLGASLGRERITYKNFLGKGDIDSVGIDIIHAPGKATLLRADAGWRRETLEQPARSWHEFIVGLSASREFPFGFAVSGGGSHYWREYGAPLLWLGPEARQDRTLAAWITLSNRNIELFGFMPEITLRRERRDSNLALYDYTRTVGEIGVVRTF